MSEEDPLAQITLTPRRFGAVLAVAAMLLGLVLALVPVRVAPVDPALGPVNCGNTIGGVETPWVLEDLGQPTRETTIAYIAMCEEAISDRGTTVLLLVVPGLIGGLALSVVRWGSARGPASPGSAPPSGPAPA
ncbi:hypothetical protein ACOBQX_19675 [Actinokineospora sp. G85]|uniref:hypothetical protein n=1 Tax=Actinokineospora sp. G85 TaxID=3406626 RepID=UPI003C78CD12